MSHQMRACKHNFSFSCDRNRSNPKACDTCAMEQRIAELETENLRLLGQASADNQFRAIAEAERDQLKAEVAELKANLDGITRLMSDER